MIEGLMGAELEGYDVALALCGNDPAVHGAREALRIPVVGITESAILSACTLGRRFGIICMEGQSVVLVEQNLVQYRLADRAVSRRPARSSASKEFRELPPGMMKSATRQLNFFGLSSP